jgi:hypothetical protein
MDVAILEKEALLLPETERAILAERLLESISHSTSTLRESWVREADERMQAFRSGNLTAVDGPQAMADLRSRFAK